MQSALQIFKLCLFVCRKQKKKEKEKPMEHFQTAALLQDRRPLHTAVPEAGCAQAVARSGQGPWRADKRAAAATSPFSTTQKALAPLGRGKLAADTRVLGKCWPAQLPTAMLSPRDRPTGHIYRDGMGQTRAGPPFGHSLHSQHLTKKKKEKHCLVQWQ